MNCLNEFQEIISNLNSALLITCLNCHRSMKSKTLQLEHNLSLKMFTYNIYLSFSPQVVSYKCTNSSFCLLAMIQYSLLNFWLFLWVRIWLQVKNCKEIWSLVLFLRKLEHLSSFHTPASSLKRNAILQDFLKTIEFIFS